MTDRICVTCNAPLIRRPDEKPSVFALRSSCNKRCAAFHRAASGRPPTPRSPTREMPERLCVTCNAPLERRYREPTAAFVRRRSCSLKCRQRQCTKPREIADCAVCGTPFEVKHKGHRNCSADCGTKAMNDRIKSARGTGPNEGFVIAYVRNPKSRAKKPLRYVEKVYATEAEARWVLADLLKPYPAGHEWRRRLSVQAWTAKADTTQAPSLGTLAAEVEARGVALDDGACGCDGTCTTCEFKRARERREARAA
jgi:hypothetical protein